MRLSKTVAMVGFHICSSVFIAISAYGILLYMDPSGAQALSGRDSLLFASAIAACILGLCFFGIRWDRAKIEEARSRPPAPPAPSTRKKKRS